MERRGEATLVGNSMDNFILWIVFLIILIVGVGVYFVGKYLLG